MSSPALYREVKGCRKPSPNNLNKRVPDLLSVDYIKGLVGGATIGNVATGPPDPDKDVIFEGGFSVEDDQTSLEPTAPVPNTGDERLMFEFVKKPDDDKAKLNLKIPEVRPRKVELGRPLTPIGTEDYSYLMFTYRVADPSAAKPTNPLALPVAMSNTERKFVFTGSYDTNIASYVESNVFVPVEQLQLRLCGTKEQREQAYKLDWLTFCAYATSISTWTRENGPYPRLKLALPANYNELQGEVDGSHLSTRNSAGGLADSAKFITTLLQPKENSDYSNIPQFIFRRWCQVAYAAAITPKSPFSVKARFWDFPNAVYNNIELIYDSKLHLNNLCNKVWTDAMRLAHYKALANMVADPTGMNIESSTLRFRFRAPQECGRTWERDYFPLGSHPQGFYTIWVSIADRKQMVDLGYRVDSRAFPAYGTNVSSYGTLTQPWEVPQIPIKDAKTTQTTIKETQITAAGNWPRCKTQSAVMNKISATQVAEKLWAAGLPPGENLKRAAEWLHRSAYSYGGLDPKRHPDTSQSVKNLVFGTYEVNTEMIRYESYLKRLASFKLIEGTNITLTTELDTSDWGNNALSWFVRHLTYTWYIPLGKGGEHVKEFAKGQTRFDLFSRKHPTLFEVTLDEEFDKLWMGSTNSKPTVEGLTSLYLVDQKLGEILGMRSIKSFKGMSSICGIHFVAGRYELMRV